MPHLRAGMAPLKLYLNTAVRRVTDFRTNEYRFSAGFFLKGVPGRLRDSHSNLFRRELEAEKRPEREAIHSRP
jgi:hypothetical protein